ncbi:hypothetical protein PSPO01_08744 [Paraphaeosphaeria sporulosa]
MLSHTVLLALVAAVGAVPLNINLGAYSPALVVGDGEISLGAAGAAGASELMATLAQGAQQGAAGAAAQQGQRNAEVQQGEAAPQGEQQGGAQPAEQQGQPAEAEAAKRGNLVRDINEILKKREAAPEPTELAHIDAVSRAVEWIKRDINSFNAALGYAERAQQNQPKIELGTGAEGSGVGITVNAGLNVPANSAANGAAAPKAAGRAVKRSEEVVDEAEAPKMTLVAITEV